MKNNLFETENGIEIPAVDESQMREVDRIAVEDFGLSVLQMMENAGRNLATFIIESTSISQKIDITVAAGTGGNGGGGICAARHLHNHGYKVKVLLTKSVNQYSGAAGAQLGILMAAGIKIVPINESCF